MLNVAEHDFYKYSTEPKTIIKSPKSYRNWQTLVTSFKIDSTTYSSRQVSAWFQISMWLFFMPPTEHQQLINKIKSKFQCGKAGLDYCVCHSANDVRSFQSIAILFKTFCGNNNFVCVYCII